MVLRRTYSVKELSASMNYVSERLREAKWYGQAFGIRDASREIRVDMRLAELCAFASSLDGRLGWFHIALEAFYEVNGDGEYDPALTNVFQTHIRFLRSFAHRAKWPWSRLTVKLVP
ncbi:hypothetical protein I6B53_10215 [Schaalia sp. 19OD2882]|uniref:hypothetical protein n=1 Tax=Schaalia sp. 19OD2882 TaxID=2794089 RepID=UPI001C1EF397|nr:hypothetical protein [Schaalia sp. 19OD2882]QWW19440.1 hypothetical protein I6B53_10215 [Schaalia sp. 19OD2882]